MDAIATTTPETEDDAVIQPAIAEGYRVLVDTLIRHFENLTAQHGYSIRAGFDVEDFANVIISLVEGLSLRTRSVDLTGNKAAKLRRAGALAVDALTTKFFETVEEM